MLLCCCSFCFFTVANWFCEWISFTLKTILRFQMEWTNKTFTTTLSCAYAVQPQVGKWDQPTASNQIEICNFFVVYLLFPFCFDVKQQQQIWNSWQYATRKGNFDAISTTRFDENSCGQTVCFFIYKTEKKESICIFDIFNFSVNTKNWHAVCVCFDLKCWHFKNCEYFLSEIKPPYHSLFYALCIKPVKILHF